MSGQECETILNLLPEWERGLASSEESERVRAHVNSCPDCKQSLALIQALQNARPTPPDALETRVKARLREDLHPGDDAVILGRFGVRRLIPTWAMSAAAILVLALGTKAVMDGMGTELVLDPIAVAAQEPLPEAWLWDDGMVAGAPVFDGLSEEDLEALLEEVEG